jgi:hypothetical protein
MLERGLLRPEDMEPPLDPFGFYFDAFQELSSCRQSGFGPGPIPFTAALEYSTLYEIEDRDDFLYLIRVMDNTYLSLEAEKSKKKSGAKNGSSNSGKANHRKPGR